MFEHIDGKKGIVKNVQYVMNIKRRVYGFIVECKGYEWEREVLMYEVRTAFGNDCL